MQSRRKFGIVIAIVALGAAVFIFRNSYRSHSLLGMSGPDHPSNAKHQCFIECRQRDKYEDISNLPEGAPQEGDNVCFLAAGEISCTENESHNGSRHDLSCTDYCCATLCGYTTDEMNHEHRDSWIGPGFMYKLQCNNNAYPPTFDSPDDVQALVNACKPCYNDSSCADGKSCTLDICNENNVCENPIDPNSTNCGCKADPDAWCQGQMAQNNTVCQSNEEQCIECVCSVGFCVNVLVASPECVNSSSSAGGIGGGPAGDGGNNGGDTGGSSVATSHSGGSSTSPSSSTSSRGPSSSSSSPSSLSSTSSSHSSVSSASSSQSSIPSIPSSRSSVPSFPSSRSSVPSFPSSRSSSITPPSSRSSSFRPPSSSSFPGNLGGTTGGTQGGTFSGVDGGTNGGNLGGTFSGTNGGTQGGTFSGTNGGNVGGTFSGTQGGNIGGTFSGTNGGNIGGTFSGTNGGTQGGVFSGTNGGTNGGNFDGTLGGTIGDTVAGTDSGTAGGNGGNGCFENSDCLFGICENGSCDPCLLNSECSSGLCVNGRCSSGASSSRTVLVSNICGNRQIDPYEVCDDGNLNNGDGCSSQCQLEIRGCRSDQECTTGRCMDGNCFPCATNNECAIGQCQNNICSAPTLVAAAGVCGNGVLESSEECDDSNVRDFDGCNTTCFLEIGICGDGKVQKLLGEQCEASLHDSSLPYSCQNCRYVSTLCGDGKLDAGEECDLGQQNSTSPNAQCRPDCSRSRCGDGIIDTTEICDDGNLINNDGCDRSCRVPNGTPTQVASLFTNQNIAFPNQPNFKNIPFQLPLAQLQPLIQAQGPVGDTGPAAVAVIAAGAASGLAWIRRKKK